MPNLRGKTWTTSTPANVEDAQYWEDHLISDTAASKAASSVQSVNNTTPDAQGNVDIVALPDGGTVGQVLTKQSSVDGDADWEDPASSGHTIEDEDGNTMPYQETLQFENAEVTNDSVNNKTIVDCKGSKGDAATITVGTVTTLPAGSQATVVNSGTSGAAVFDFGIPKGADGSGIGDMTKAEYATNGEAGVVDEAVTLKGLTASIADLNKTSSLATVAAKSVKEIIENISPSLISTSMPSYVANSLPVRKKDITNDFYNGSLRAEIAAGNFKNVRPGDYIIGQSSGSTYYVACLDYRLGKGDQTNNTNYPAYGTHHLGLMLFKHNGATRLWAGYGNTDKSWRISASDKGRCPWNAAADVDPTNSEAVGTNNTNITRQYNGANVSGYMGSFIRERIDEIILTEDFIADFGSANVLKYREINGNTVATDKPSGGQGNWNGCTSGWSWYDRFLDLPSEIELYGSRVFGSAYDIGCQCEQLPFLRNAAIHDFFPRIDIWTKAVANSSYAAGRGSRGNAAGDVASRTLWACPLACVR